jgi:hypothetical protein
MRIDDKIAIIRDAIKTGKHVHCTFDGYRRETCCHIVGTTKGVWRGLFWQFDGTTSQGPQSLPNWRYFDLAELTDVIAVEGEWHRG